MRSHFCASIHEILQNQAATFCNLLLYILEEPAINNFRIWRCNLTMLMVTMMMVMVIMVPMMMFMVVMMMLTQSGACET